MSFVAVLQLLFAFLPASVRAFVLGFIAVVLLIVALKIVAAVLNAIPFL